MHTILADGSAYASLFTNFWPLLDKVYLSLSKVAYLILLASFIAMIWGRLGEVDPVTLLKPIVTVVALVGIIAMWKEIAGEKGILWAAGRSLGEGIQADAWTALEQVIAQKLEEPWWKKIADFINGQAVRDGITYGLIYFGALIAKMIMWVAGAFMIFFQGFAFGLGPLFIALLGLQSTRSIGVNFLLMCVGLALWHLAWALVDLGTVNLASQSLNSYVQGPVALLALTGWVIIGYVLAPIAVTAALKAGGNVGGALTGGAVKGAGSAVGAALAIKTMGASAAVGGAAGASAGSQGAGGGGGSSSDSSSGAPSFAQASPQPTYSSAPDSSESAASPAGAGSKSKTPASAGGAAGTAAGGSSGGDSSSSPGDSDSSIIPKGGSPTPAGINVHEGRFGRLSQKRAAKGTHVSDLEALI